MNKEYSAIFGLFLFLVVASSLLTLVGVIPPTVTLGVLSGTGLLTLITIGFAINANLDMQQRIFTKMLEQSSEPSETK